MNMVCAKNSKEEFVNRVLEIAVKQGYSVKLNRDGLRQVDFGNKKLHEKHLASLFPDILIDKADINKLIEAVAPGRPCSHRPMREIIEILRKQYKQSA